GTPFTIPDSLNGSYGFTEGRSSDTTKEFNPKNLGYHPVVDEGANQPILATGFGPVDISGPHSASGGTISTVNFVNTWNPGKHNGNCVEITSGTGSGQVRTIAGHNATGITRVDPYFSTAPSSDSVFYIRKCSSYSTAEWPRFTGGTLDLTDGSATATISGLTNGIPSTVIKGWYIYAGTLSGSPLAPPAYSTSGWFQVTDISPGASDAGTGSVDITITPTPTANYNGSYAISAGLGNAFVPPYGPWSRMGCADCHDTDDPRDPSGPHSSSRQWMLRTLESQMFPWYYGGLSGEGSSSTTDALEVKMVGYPSGDNAGWNNANAELYTCHNCHRADVYKTANSYLPSGSSFVNFSWRNQGRVNHVPHSTGASESNIFKVFCFNCHGGDNRANPYSGEDEPYKALGGMHGSNLGIGNRLNASTPAGASFRGRRLLNGVTWTGVTRAYTNTGVKCFSGGQDSSVASCKRSYNNSVGTAARYAYYSGPDIDLPEMTSAVAGDTSGGHTGVQSGDVVVITFSGETNAATVNSGNIDAVLALNNGHVWGSIAGAVWSTTNYTNDTLTVTIGSGATVYEGDTVTSDITIKSIVNTPITDTVTITGDFGFWIVDEALAGDASGGGPGIQAGDTVVIRFNDATAGTTIDASNIDSALTLSNSHSWKDGSGAIDSAAWSTTTYSNDTLTITLSATTSAPTVDILDIITLDGTIKDGSNNPITNDPFLITGTFDSVDSGVVAQWRLDEGSGTIAYDDTGNFNHAALYGTPAWTAGIKDGALIFDYSDDYIAVNDSDSLDLSTAGSIELWFNKDSNRYYQTYIYKGTSYYIRDYGTTGRLQFSWGGSTIMTDEALATGVWYHLMATCDGADQIIYINGEAIKSKGSGCPSAASNTADLYIGLGFTGSTSHYDGVIDDIVMYNRALTGDEVRSRFNKLKGAVADDSSGSGEGVQASDRVVISFNTATNGAAINASNIDTALALNGGHSWKDGSGNIGSAVWSTTTFTDDTLTITMSDATSTPTIGMGDFITTDGTIKDSSGKLILASVQISGSFGAMAGMPDNLVAYWKMDESSGTTADDSSFYNNSGITYNSPTWVQGRFGNALHFTGASAQYVSVADDNALDFTKEMTIELWAKKDSQRSNQPYINKGPLTIMDDGATGKIKFVWGNMSVTSASVADMDTWNYIVATYDGLTMKLYLNGSFEGSLIVPFIQSPDTSPLLIGAGSGAYFDGAIDDLAVYNRALDPSEITNRYGANLVSAKASDPSGNGKGIQAGDRVVIKFNGATDGVLIDETNIDSALGLGGNSWLDGTGNIGSAIWSTDVNANDTLTVTLSAASGVPSISIGDTVALDGTIKDTSARPIIGSVVLAGTFDTLLGGTVAYWNFEEGAGNTAYDSSANGNDATINSAVRLVDSGKVGSGIDFGSNQSVIAPTSASFDLTTSLSMEFWLKKDSNQTSQKYIYKGSAYYIRDYSNQGRLGVYLGNGQALLSDTVLSTGLWHHVVVTYRSADDTVRLYIDGQLDKENTSWTTDPLINTTDLTMGSGTIDFKLDEVAIYSRALAAAEVGTRYGSNLKSAIADDNSGSGSGIQSLDRVTIFFSGETDGAVINAGNIDSALSLGGNSWLDGSGSIGSALWTTASNPNDTLTVTLSDATSVPSLVMGDLITLDGTI
ncbi:MAG: LamG-like jellyroll fold domain-containing protein, partial [bacterium]|nr:LamG-like jellyroll fold domain-containing protein [bacterium]